MSDSAPEQGQSKIESVSTENIFRLNEEFSLFDPNRSQPLRMSSFHGTGLRSLIRLQIADSLIIPMDLLAYPVQPSNRRQTEAFTPADPTKGYTVTSEDYDLDKRRVKFQELSRITIPPEHFQLLLAARSAGETLYKLGLSKLSEKVKVPSYYDIEPIFLELLRKLRFKVVFTETGLSYLSIPNEDNLGMGRLQFNHFFPSDLEKLAYPAGLVTLLKEGLLIASPESKEFLESIKGEFFLIENLKDQVEIEEQTPEQPNENIPPLGVKPRK